MWYQNNRNWVNFAAIICCLALPGISWALTNPIDRSATVTVTVPQPSPSPLPSPSPSAGEPDTPVLIAPANNSTISSRAPSFIFNPALCSIRTSHYQLWIDGAKNLDHINAATTTIVVQPAASLSDGTHTWSIQAIGSNGVSRNSATWSFTLDTTAPLILINQVAGQTAGLSSLDLSPWQKEVSFSTTDRYPVITGQGEAGAFISISLIGNKATTTVNTTIGLDRQFTLQSNISLPPERYTVSVSSSDPAGNNTALPSFFLDINSTSGQLVITLPSPLPKLAITVPITIPSTLMPVTAFPLIPPTACPIYWWIWLIIIILLIYIIYLKRKLKHQKITKDNSQIFAEFAKPTSRENNSLAANPGQSDGNKALGKAGSTPSNLK